MKGWTEYTPDPEKIAAFREAQQKVYEPPGWRPRTSIDPTWPMLGPRPAVVINQYFQGGTMNEAVKLLLAVKKERDDMNWGRVPDEHIAMIVRDWFYEEQGVEL